ncbi:hypothetical protein M0812_23487 [Anaeramoeba flamelloides]|uniref:Mannan endo-1,6-alpha-mannosidase n=1 Tax=Anaeramoeba flamelloides TaxID=1746091 RepID=A0AAV7YSR1_9EUKA|nr:hypothetical protein M0812_23487 [Anaeramoeba flamelloides]
MRNSLVITFIFSLFLLNCDCKKINGRNDPVDYLALARKTSDYLDVYLQGFVDEDCTFGGFVNSSKKKDWSFCWPNFEMVSADAAMIRLLVKENYPITDQEVKYHLVRLERVVDWEREYLWDVKVNNGGYYAAILSYNTEKRDESVKYIDDLAYAGIAMMQCYYTMLVTGQEDHPLTAKCLQYAAECGDWLLQVEDESIWASNVGGALLGDDAIEGTLGVNTFRNHTALWEKHADLVLDIIRHETRVSARPRIDGDLCQNHTPPKTAGKPEFFAYENSIVSVALLLSNFDEESEALLTAINDYFWLEEERVYTQSSLSGSISTVFTGWATENLLTRYYLKRKRNFPNNPSLDDLNNHPTNLQITDQKTRSLDSFQFIANLLTNHETGAVFQDTYSNGQNRRFEDGTHFTVDCAFALRFFALAQLATKYNEGALGNNAHGEVDLAQETFTDSTSAASSIQVFFYLFATTLLLFYFF